MFEAIKWRWVGLYNLDLCFITSCWDQGAASACQTEIMRGGSWGKMGAFSSVILDQTTIVDLHLHVCLLIIKQMIIVFSSGRWGIQSNLIVLNGTTEGAGIRGSTAAAANAERGPTAAAKRASTINLVAFQKGIRL